MVYSNHCHRVSCSVMLELGSRAPIVIKWPAVVLQLVIWPHFNGNAQRRAALRYTGGRPLGAGKFAISMETAQEVVWLLVISLSYPRQTLSNICVQWLSRARDACAKKTVPRRDFPPFLRAPLMAFSSKGLLHFVTNDWR